MDTNRPNPDKLLEAIAPSQKSAQLKIFFGYAAGVGKSYAMLKAAHELKKQGIDVVVGYLEPHGRPETEVLLEGLEIIPSRKVEYAGASLLEFDLDAAVKRHPQVLLVDELPHTNAPGCRHTKRWQDIEEIMRAGISVYTTVNVQHLASLEDLIAQITGVQIRETVPDVIFDRADEVTLVDISPDDLLKRFKDGKIYKGAQVERALGNYFKKANLVALREIALRRTAERVHTDVDMARTTSNVQTIWATSEKLLCIVGPDAGSASAIRATARLAGALGAPWQAIVVEVPTVLWQSRWGEKQLRANTDLVESVGGKVVYRSATFPAWEILRYANENNFTKLVTHHSRFWSLTEWIDKFFYIFAPTALDVLWIHPRLGKKATTAPFSADEVAAQKASLNWKAYLSACGYVGIAFLLSAFLSLFFTVSEANVALLYLISVIVSAVVYGQGASVFAAFLTAVLLSFGLSSFTWRLSWGNVQYLLSFALTLGMGLMAAFATSRLKQQAELARNARKTAEDLYEFGIALSQANGLHQIIATAEKKLADIFGREFAVLVKSGPSFQPIGSGKTVVHTSPTEWAVANYAATSGQPAGVGTQTLPRSKAFYLPLSGTEGVVGVLAIIGDEPIGLANQALVEKFSHTLSVRLETVLVAEDAQKIYWQAEKERLRSDLLTSVSENLKKPLERLSSAAASLANENNPSISDIQSEAARLERVVENLTQLARFENGKLPINRQPVEVASFLREALQSFVTTASHPISVGSAAPRANFDPLLIGQVIFNLVENAVRYTPAGTPIEVSAKILESALEISVRDHGDGLPEDQLEKIFDKYYRLNTRTQGAGLGLTVCRAIVEAHGGRIWSQNAAPKGLQITLTLPQAR